MSHSSPANPTLHSTPIVVVATILALSACGTVAVHEFQPSVGQGDASILSRGQTTRAVEALVAPRNSAPETLGPILKKEALALEASLLRAVKTAADRDGVEALRFCVLAYAAEFPSHVERNRKLVLQALAEWNGRAAAPESR